MVLWCWSSGRSPPSRRGPPNRANQFLSSRNRWCLWILLGKCRRYLASWARPGSSFASTLAFLGTRWSACAVWGRIDPIRCCRSHPPRDTRWCFWGLHSQAHYNLVWLFIYRIRSQFLWKLISGCGFVYCFWLWNSACQCYWTIWRARHYTREAECCRHSWRSGCLDFRYSTPCSCSLEFAVHFTRCDRSSLPAARQLNCPLWCSYSWNEWCVPEMLSYLWAWKSIWNEFSSFLLMMVRSDNFKFK